MYVMLCSAKCKVMIGLKYLSLNCLNTIFVLQVKATGQELFDQVCDVLKIKDPHFFGISVVKSKITYLTDIHSLYLR